jgi:hypothetical protein
MPDNNNHDDDLCGIEGNAEEPVKRREFNRWLAMAIRHHVAPTKELLKETNKLITDHLVADKLMRAEVMGGLYVIKWMIAGMPAMLLFALYLMHKAGML